MPIRLYSWREREKLKRAYVSDRARDGCKILGDLVKRITAGFDVTISNLHHDEQSYVFSCEVRRNRWFNKTLICTIDFNDHITYED